MALPLPGLATASHKVCPLHLILELFLGKCHVLWEAGDRDVEVVVVLAADVFDEVNAVHEAAVDGLPLVLSLGRIAS